MLDLVFLLIILSIAFLAIAPIRQFLLLRQLKSKVSSYGSEILILIPYHVELSHFLLPAEYKVQRVSTQELTDRQSFCRQLMKKTGVQSLPMQVWISQDGEIRGKALQTVHKTQK